MAALTSVSDDIARHHCAILQRSSELCAERERAAVARLTKLASGSPPAAPPEEPAVPDQPAPEPSREVVACKDILTECHELLSRHAKGVLDDAMFVLKQVSMAQRVAALETELPEGSPKRGRRAARPERQAEGSLFLSSSLPPTLATIGSRPYRRDGAVVAARTKPGEGDAVTAAFDAAAAKAAEAIESSVAQQARLAQERQASLAAAAERGAAAAALLSEGSPERAAELSASATMVERGLAEEKARNEVQALFWGAGPLGLRLRRLGGAPPPWGGSDDGDAAGETTERYVLVRVAEPGDCGADGRPRPYSETASWLRMVGVQAQDDQARSNPDAGGTASAPAAFRAAAAAGFSASFVESPAPVGGTESERERELRRKASTDPARFDR